MSESAKFLFLAISIATLFYLVETDVKFLIRSLFLYFAVPLIVLSFGVQVVTKLRKHTPVAQTAGGHTPQELAQQHLRQKEILQSKYNEEASQFYETYTKIKTKDRLEEAEKKLSHVLDSSWRLGGNTLLPRSKIPKGKVDMDQFKMMEEPLTEEIGCITVSLRAPDGQMHKRRMLPHHSTDILYQFANLCGYSTKNYGIYSIFPRKLIVHSESITMNQLNLTKSFVACIDLKD